MHASSRVRRARPRWRSRWYHPHASRECQTGWRPVPHLSARLRAGRAAPRCARAGCHRSGACALGQQGALLTGEASAVDQASRQLYWAVRAAARGDNHAVPRRSWSFLCDARKSAVLPPCSSCTSGTTSRPRSFPVRETLKTQCGGRADHWVSQLASGDYQAGAHDPQFDQRQGRC